MEVDLLVVLVFRFESIDVLFAVIIAPGETKGEPVILHVASEDEFKRNLLSFTGFHPNKGLWCPYSLFIDVRPVNWPHSFFVYFMLFKGIFIK